MKVWRVGRRQFLRGAGVTLGLPILPSLLPRASWGADLQTAPRFVAFWSGHGGVYVDNFYPAASALPNVLTVDGDHQISMGPLVRTVSGGMAVLSPALQAPATVLTDSLLRKINVLHGFDAPHYFAHQSTVHLGNYASDGIAARPTIDQTMAYSPTFNAGGTLTRVRSLHVSSGDKLSWGYSNPQARTGTIQSLAATSGTQAIFNQLFPAGSVGTSPPPPAPRPSIVDRMHENYRRLRDGNRRLSVADRVRLDEHMARLDELQRTVNVAPVVCNPGASPANVGADYEDPKKFFSIVNDLIAAAFACGVTRVATVRVTGPFNVPYTGNWHMDIAHNHDQTLMVPAARAIFEGTLVDLARKLDVGEGTGQTLLDSTLIQWAQESGSRTHENTNMPVVMAGGGSLGIKGGLYCDYRNHSRPLPGNTGHYGLHYNRWMATVFKAMKMPWSEYDNFGVPGYGDTVVDTKHQSGYPNGVPATAGEPLPFIT